MLPGKGETPTFSQSVPTRLSINQALSRECSKVIPKMQGVPFDKSLRIKATPEMLNLCTKSSEEEDPVCFFLLGTASAESVSVRFAWILEAPSL